MDTNLAKTIKKSIALALVSVMSFGIFFSVDTLFAEEEIPLLTKDQFIEGVLADNITIYRLERQLNQLNEQLDNMGSIQTMISSVHSLVPRYNQLGKKLNATKANDDPRYYEYMVLGSRMAGVPEAATPDEQARYIVLSNELTDEEKLTIMGPGELIEYYAIMDAMRAFGIDTSTVSADQEYETFILPVYVGTRSLKSGIASLEDGIRSAKGSFSVGAGQLYNTVLMLEGILNMLDQAYATSVTNYEFAKEKHNKGLVSDISLEMNKNNMETAKLNRDKMARDIENLKMNMNVMMGTTPNQDFEVANVKLITTPLRSIQSYINEALVQRSEIISLNRSIEDQLFKMIFIKSTFNASDNRYIIEEKQLELYRIDLEKANNDITVEIYNSYNDVLEKELALELSNLELQDAYRQYKELAFNVEQGFVTESLLANINMLVTSAANDAATKSRDYLTAVESLLDGSSFGPGMNNKGGTGLE